MKNEWKAIARELAATIRAVEWVIVPSGWGDDDEICPWCGGYKVDEEEIAAGIEGHKPDCIRQIALAKIAKEMGKEE